MRTKTGIVTVLALVLIGCSAPTESAAGLEPSQPEVTPLPATPIPPADSGGEEPPPPADTGEAAGESAAAPRVTNRIIEFDIPANSRPHDVAPSPDGAVWYTGQGSGTLGRLDRASGEVALITLPGPSRPHGVIVGPDGAPWITDGGSNAIVRVDPLSGEAQVFPLPQNRSNANLNTAAFDRNGVLWFTGQNGIYGRLDPASGDITVYDAPRGRGPYGITATPDGEIYYASLAGSYIAHVDIESGEATVIEPPTPNQGARRVWSDSQGRIWVSEWNAGQLGLYDPPTGEWREWPLPGPAPQAYAVYVDETDIVWVTDFGGNALVRFDPQTETFDVYPFPSAGAAVRQLLGSPGEIWGAESALDKLFVLYPEP